MSVPKFEFKNIEIQGEISIRPCTNKINSKTNWSIMIMGPTGAGKSTIIEALSGTSELNIAKDQLEGFTQAVTAYELVNVTHLDWPIYLVDTPGFADRKISELQILSMVQRWCKDYGDVSIDHILYLTPITDIRLSGSRKRIIDTFMAITGIHKAKDITVVTTMWDNVWSASQKARAESSMKYLRETGWKDCITEGTRLSKFLNTQHSALTLVDDALDITSDQSFYLDQHYVSEAIDGSLERNVLPFEANLLTDLQSRIDGLRGEEKNVKADIAQALMEKDVELLPVLIERLLETRTALVRFEVELEPFLISPPLPPPPDPEDQRPPEKETRRGIARVFEAVKNVGQTGLRRFHARKQSWGTNK